MMFFRTVWEYLLLLLFFILSFSLSLHSSPDLDHFYVDVRQTNALSSPWKVLAYGIMQEKFKFPLSEAHREKFRREINCRLFEE